MKKENGRHMKKKPGMKLTKWQINNIDAAVCEAIGNNIDCNYGKKEEMLSAYLSYEKAMYEGTLGLVAPAQSIIYDLEALVDDIEQESLSADLVVSTTKSLLQDLEDFATSLNNLDNMADEVPDRPEVRSPPLAALKKKMSKKKSKKKVVADWRKKQVLEDKKRTLERIKESGVLG